MFLFELRSATKLFKVFVLPTAILLSALGCGSSDGKVSDENPDYITDAPENAGDGGQSGGNPAEFSAPNPTKREWSGTTDKIIDSDTNFKKGYLPLKLSHAGDGNFIIWLTNSKGQQLDLLVNEVGPYAGYLSAALPQDGTYSFEVTGNGAWTIETYNLDVAKSVPSSLSGTGDSLSPVFYLSGEQRLKVQGSHDGGSNFIVKLIDTSDGSMEDLVFNEIGDYSGEKSATSNESGYFFLSVQAFEGVWSLTLEK